MRGSYKILNGVTRLYWGLQDCNGELQDLGLQDCMGGYNFVTGLQDCSGLQVCMGLKSM